MSMPPAYRHRLSVRFRDSDAMGHVNHAVYFTYLEQCRLTFSRARLHQLKRSEGSQPASDRTGGYNVTMVYIFGKDT